MRELQIVTIDPAHFHAALVHKQMPPGIDSRVYVYAPPGPDVEMHLQRLADFNSRTDRPTHWDVRATIAPDFLSRFLHEKPGDVVVLAGRNRTKIDTMLECVAAGYHVLADKPWIICRSDFPKLERVLGLAREKNLVVHDMMTERYEITSILQRKLVQSSDVFGTILPGTFAKPSVRIESVHGLKKLVAGQPLRRPLAFFDVLEQGAALADVGTHLVDLVQWMLADQEVLKLSDVIVHQSQRWPTLLAPDEFFEITGESSIPPWIATDESGKLILPCNDRLNYQLNGVHIELVAIWDVECPHGDSHLASFDGTQAQIEVCSTSNSAHLYIRPKHRSTEVISAANRVLTEFPSFIAQANGVDYIVEVPASARTTHESHFQAVISDFVSIVSRKTELRPAESAPLLSKYWTTTSGGAPVKS